MNERTRRRLRDARDACERVEWETLGFDETMYVNVSTVTYAVNWLPMTLEEALTVAVREDPDLERLIPDARSAIGLRNRIVHGYDSVDNRLIWRVVQDKVPALKAQIEAVLGATA
jgi:uncharacterized protein with HEPN domain